MFTAIRQGDGTLRFETHLPPSEFTPEEARAALDAAAPLLAELRERARESRTATPAPPAVASVTAGREAFPRGRERTLATDPA